MFAFQPGVSRTPSRPTLPSPIRPRPTWVIPPPARKQFVHRFTPSKPTLRTRIPAFPWTGAVGGARTHTPSREGDFKSPVSAISPRRRCRLGPRGCRERTPRCKPWYEATGSTPNPAILSKNRERQDAQDEQDPRATSPLPTAPLGENPDLHNHDSHDNDAQRLSSPLLPSLPSLLRTVSPSPSCPSRSSCPKPPIPSRRHPAACRYLPMNCLPTRGIPPADSPSCVSGARPVKGPSSSCSRTI